MRIESDVMATSSSPPPRGMAALPAELLLGVIKNLHAEDYVSLAIAMYPLFRNHGLAPPLTQAMLNRMFIQGSSPAPVKQWRLPAELTDMVLKHLSPDELLSLLSSDSSLFRMYTPYMSCETKILMTRWLQG